MLEGQPKFEHTPDADAVDHEIFEELLSGFENSINSEIRAVEAEFERYEGNPHDFVCALRERSQVLVESAFAANENFHDLTVPEQISLLHAVVENCVSQNNNNYRFIVSGVVNDFLHPRVVEERENESRFHEDPASVQFGSHYPPRELFSS